MLILLGYQHLFLCQLVQGMSKREKRKTLLLGGSHLEPWAISIPSVLLTLFAMGSNPTDLPWGKTLVMPQNNHVNIPYP